MVTLDLEALNIEELAALRDNVIEQLAEKAAARQAELESELEKLNLYGNKPRQEGAVRSGRKAEEGRLGEGARCTGCLNSKPAFYLAGRAFDVPDCR